MSDQTGAQHLTDADFEKTIKDSTTPVMVDFYAEWCGPCQMAAPVIDKLAGEYHDKMLIVKLNVDDNQNTAQKYGVMSIPTIIMFKAKDGELVELDRQTGFPGEQGFRNMIEKQLN